MVSNENIADHLQLISHLFLRNRDPWRSRAFSKVADMLRTRSASLEIRDQKVQDAIPGMGSAINTVIVEFVSTGDSRKLQKLRALLPEAVVERFDSLVCRRKVNQLLKPLTEAGVDWGFAGSMRRGCRTVKDVDVIVCLGDEALERKLILDTLKSAGLRADVRNGREKVGVSIPIKNQGRSFTLDLNFTTPQHRGAHYLYFTGPRSYNIEQRRRAKVRGLLLNQRGLYRGRQLLAGATEQEIFDALGEKFLAPDQRA